MANERNHNLDDTDGRKQAQERLGDRARESGAMADMDSGDEGVGAAANDGGVVLRLRQKSLEVEKRDLERAIWRAADTLMITPEEAEAAVAKYCK